MPPVWAGHYAFALPCLIEVNEEYVQLAEERIQQARQETTL